MYNFYVMIKENTKKQIGILGGMFDPPHYGHIFAARSVKEKFGLDEVWLVPNFKPAHKTGFSSYENRLELVRLFVECMKSAEAPEFEWLKVSDIETRLKTKFSWTVDLVDLLKIENPEVDFSLIIGTDELLALKTWKDIDSLLQEIRIIVIARKGYKKPTLEEIGLPEPWPEKLLENYVEANLLEMSSSVLRERFQKVTLMYANYFPFFPKPIYDYIVEKKLYGTITAKLPEQGERGEWAALEDFLIKYAEQRKNNAVQ